MRRFVSARRLLVLVWIPVVVVFGACDDDDPVDPGVPENRYWSQVELPAGLPAGTLTGIAISGNSSAAVGVGADGNGILLENSSQGWRSVELAALTAASIWDVGIDDMGRRVLVGFRSSGHQLVLAENPDWVEVLPSPILTGGLLSIAVDGGGTFFTVGGQTNAIAAWTGSLDGAWTPVTIDTPGDPNDKVLVDVAYGVGAWVGCGYDDGGEGTLEQPYSVLMVDEGSGWELINAPCGGCGNQEFMAVAVSATGGIWLGGANTDFSDGNMNYSAFLRVYARDIEEWTEIVLPEPDTLERVNEILISADGDIYLACGVDTASLVRLPAEGGFASTSNIEWRASKARLRGLAQAGNGSVYAVGEDTTSGAMPIMLRRVPVD